MFKKMKTGVKLISAFVIVALIAGIVGALGILNINAINGNDTLLYEVDTVAVLKASDASVMYQRARFNALKMTVTEGNDQKTCIGNVNTYMANVDAALNEYGQLSIDDANKGIYEQIKTLWLKYEADLKKALELVTSGNSGGARDYLLNESAETATSLQNSFEDLFNYNQAKAAERSAQNNAVAASSSTIMIIVACAAVVVAVALGLFLTRSITKPILASASQLEKMGNGDDLDEMNAEKFSGEFRHMVVNLNRVRTALYGMLNDTGRLMQSAIKGDLSARADAERHKGGYKQIVEGMNNILDAVVKPVYEARDVLEEMAKGNLAVRVTGDYQGDHAIIKNALNSTIDALNGYIVEISDVLGEISKGNLNVEIESEFRGDFTKLKESINDIIASLNNVMSEINTASEQVAAGTAQVSDGSQAISQGASEQAASIEELTASVTQIAEQTRQNALSADQANAVSSEAKDNAVQGNEQMKALQQAMQDINESSASIGKIIKVIDDIAFQTNILALNAAVEAARAGVHGKGFAVVAEEVRTLAAKSANAAKETTELIEGSIRKTEIGTHIADKTAAALENIVASVEKAVNLVVEIAAASNQQATAISEVNRGIEQMSQVVQTNSATAQEAAAAAEELSSQAALLKNMVEQFQLKASIAGKETKSLISSHNNEKPKQAIRLTEPEFGKY